MRYAFPLILAALLAPPSPAQQPLVQPAGLEADGSGGLAYLRRLAGPGTEHAWDIAVDAAGNAYVAGMSDSGDGDFDAVVVKLNPNGTTAYVARFGGAALDQASEVAVDAAGSAYVSGYTYSGDFPTTPGAFDETFNGGIDAFVAKLSPDGSRIEYATFLGGSADDFGGGIAVDPVGGAFVTGYTESGDFPTTPGAFDRTHNGISDVIAVRLAPSGSALSYSSFVGSPGVEIGYDVAFGPAGEVYLTGQATSPGFPTTPGVVSPTFNGGRADAFVLKISPLSGGLDYSTYLGGDEFDDARGVAVDAEGNAFVTGRTESLDFPTTVGAYDESYNFGRDVFVTGLAPSGAAYVYSTFVGGGGEEESGGIALGPAGEALVAGWTFSPDFPTTADAFDATFNGNYDAFVLALSGAGDSLDYSTFVGTASSDYGRGIGTDGGASAYVAGYSGFENVDAFGLKLDLPSASSRLAGVEARASAPALALSPVRPNPFSSRATLAFGLPEPSRVRLALYDVLGREVAVLLDGDVEAGTHTVVFEADGLAPGVYVYRLTAGGEARTGRMTLTR